MPVYKKNLNTIKNDQKKIMESLKVQLCKILEKEMTWIVRKKEILGISVNGLELMLRRPELTPYTKFIFPPQISIPYQTVKRPD
eukprot:1133905-Karenia_brevis.AAC.1